MHKTIATTNLVENKEVTFFPMTHNSKTPLEVRGKLFVQFFLFSVVIFVRVTKHRCSRNDKNFAYVNFASWNWIFLNSVRNSTSKSYSSHGRIGISFKQDYKFFMRAKKLTTTIELASALMGWNVFHVLNESITRRDRKKIWNLSVRRICWNKYIFSHFMFN